MSTRIPSPQDGSNGAEPLLTGAPANQRLRVAIRGVVQGVGFRPFVYRLAGGLGLRGWVANSPSGVTIEVEGTEESLGAFLLRLDAEKPPLASIQSLEHSLLDPVGFNGFTIRESGVGGQPSALVLPDIGTCSACCAELFQPGNRRYRHPFITCTHCGPRFSIITALPYDRPNTSMADFAMCDDCRAEYENPSDRRFHAQPIACPACGPQLSFLDRDGISLSAGERALDMAEGVLREGGIVALKGIGGYQLLVDARNDAAVDLLRKRKGREEKPFAVMMPSLESARRHCRIGPLEERLLSAPEAPIVLLDRAASSAGLSRSVAPRNPCLGVMLPYSPLHHLLLHDLGFPVVATSGNRTDEPICTSEAEPLGRLGPIADGLLVHNRPIVRHVDDSVARIIGGREMILRRARGYAPLPVRVNNPAGRSIVAVGAHLKNSVGLLRDGNAFLSQHIGDLETGEAFAAFERTLTDLQAIYGKGKEAACDLHPDYLSTGIARRSFGRVTAVQHHYAHILSCMAENELDEPLLGVSWDGTGLGSDGTIWGGEFLVPEGSSFRRAASFLPFRLPGGDRAAREPRRSALAVLHALFGENAWSLGTSPALRAFTPDELPAMQRMLRTGFQAPWTTSAGRLFDAASSLLDIRQRATYEGQPAMELEFAAAQIPCTEPLPLPLTETDRAPDGASSSDERMMATPSFIIDWKPLFRHLVEQVGAGTDRSTLASLFHATLAGCIVSVARRVGLAKVLLTGGCFQNRLLTEQAIARLRAEGFAVYWHQRVPPNDGGIALGQISGALRSHDTTAG